MIPDTKAVLRRRIIHRIHRIQGQLNGLQSAVEGEYNCEYLMIQSRAVEKAVASLIVQMIENDLVLHLAEMPYPTPRQTAQTIAALSDLSHR
ncbi:MAG: metal-sensing transcriptional repressor [Anaerolineae bacterium]|nr:metal-sensing transcriptional repressor [Anaerolineae bacterium]